MRKHVSTTSPHISVLLLLPQIDRGGGQRRTKAYCDLLDRSRFSLSVCVYHATNKDLVKQVVGNTTPTLISSNPSTIIQFTKKQHTRVVYTFFDGKYNKELFQLLTHFRSMGMKIVSNNVFAYYDERMDELCDHVFFQTKMMLGVKFRGNIPLHHRLSFRKYSVLPNPVYSKYFQKYGITPEKRRSLRVQLGVHEKDILVARFGRNDIVKWGDILTSTVFRMRSEASIKFLIVGIPTSRRYLLRVALLLFPSFRQQLIFKDPTADDRELMEWIQCSDIIAHGVKIGEGCSNAINEAMYWNKPVITNSTPFCDNGQVEQVDDGKTGIIANTPKEWSDAIRLLALNPHLRERMGKAGHRKAMTQYEAVLVTKLLEESITSVVDGNIPVKRITAQQRSMRTFVHWYNRWEKNRLPALSTTQHLFSLVKRAFDYVEYRLQ